MKNTTAMNVLLRPLLLCFALIFCTVAVGEVKVFPLHSTNTQEIVETLRAALGNRAQVDIIQQQLVVVADPKTLSEATNLLRKIDRLPANLRLTLTENPPTESQDPETGMLVYTTDKNSQVVDTVEGALLSADYTKFHQTVSTDGWMFNVDNQPVAVQQLELRVRVIPPNTAEIVMSFTRYENQQRRVLGRIVAGKMGTWIPLLTQRAEPATSADVVQYTSGNKPGEQLYLKVEKVFAPTKIRDK
ncbi:MAG: hypothetical protein ABW049_11195 [Spongiibacteraceae bacterium]